jgi:hypothetical protein
MNKANTARSGGKRGGIALMSRIIPAAMAAVSLMLSLAAPAAAEPSPTDLLFKVRQLDLVGKGSHVTYKFERSSSNEQILGKNFTDELKLEFTKAGEKGARDIAMHVFTGNSARDVQNWPDLSTNPLFLWYLDRTVAQLATLSGAEKMYLKGRIRATFDEKGKVEAIKYSYDGKEVDAYKIMLMPLKGDPNSGKMEGYDASYLTFIVSDAVPGYFIDMASTFESPRRGTPIVKEHLTLVSAGETK